MAKVVYICSYCKQMYNDRKSVSAVIERDKSGKYTGRVLNLCTQCNDKFISSEIRDMKERLGIDGHQRLKTLGWDTSDLQSYLVKWRKYLKERR